MSKIRIANAQFEWELEQISTPQLETSFCIHPIYLQLQFLACLYSDPDDVVLVTHLPDEEYKDRVEALGIPFPKLQLYTDSNIPKLPLDCWGTSQSIAVWAKKKKLPFAMPGWECVKEVNSKEFSFLASPKLESAELLRNEQHALEWLNKTSGPRVFKSVYGLSGRGHLHIQNDLDAKAISFLNKQWKAHHPVLAEPWVNRLLDFSTQWLITEDGNLTFLGVTICQNDSRGGYKSTIVQPDDSIDPCNHLLIIHKEEVKRVLHQMYSKGYFGHVGVDAMIYEIQGKTHLHPIVEINARKTMGWVALTLQKRYFREKTIAMSYDNVTKTSNLLPNFIVKAKDETTTFSKVLQLEILEKNKSWKDVYF